MRTTTFKREKFVWKCFMRKYDVLRHGPPSIVTRINYCKIDVGLGIIELASCPAVFLKFYLLNFVGGSDPIEASSVADHFYNFLCQVGSEIIADICVGKFGPRKPHATAKALMEERKVFFALCCPLLYMWPVLSIAIYTEAVGKETRDSPCVTFFYHPSRAEPHFSSDR